MAFENLPFFSLAKKPDMPMSPSFFRVLINHHLLAFLQAVRHLLAKPWQTITTIAVLTGVFAVLLLLQVVWHQFSAEGFVLRNKIAITIYLQNDIAASQSENLFEQLRTRSDIAKIRYISSAEGLSELQKAIKLPDFSESPKDNILPVVMIIKPAKVDADSIQKLVENLKHLPKVAQVQINEPEIKALAVWANLANKIIVLGLFLLIILWSAIYYVIYLALRIQKQEIEWYRALGASSGFIRRSFLYVGLLYGLIGAVGGTIFFQISALILAPSLDRLATINLFSFKQLIDAKLVEILLVGSLLGWVSAWLVMAKEMQTSAD